MSLADEVLARHKPEPDSQAEYDNCSGCAGAWPCESVRLALSLKTAEQALEVAMCLKHSINGEHGRGGPLWAEPCPDADC